MPSSPNEATARETNHSRAGSGTSPNPAPPRHRKTWRFWGGACFVIVLLAAFGQPLLGLVNYAAGSPLYSYILLIPFVSAYLLYLRRDQLPKKYVVDLPLGDRVAGRRSRRFGVHLLVGLRWASAGR